MPQVSVAVEPVEVLDTVGAGDSYMGAFLVSLREKTALTSVSCNRALVASDNMEGGRSELRVHACVFAPSPQASRVRPPNTCRNGRLKTVGRNHEPIKYSPCEQL